MKNNLILRIIAVLSLSLLPLTSISQVDSIYEEPAIYIPNSFTPNYDGYNDVWRVDGIGIESIEIIIMNKWGKPVFTSTDLHTTWDGSNNQGDYFVQNEIYSYIVKWKPINNQIKVLTGNISVLR
jgi:gliding motility-associated-like protein